MSYPLDTAAQNAALDALLSRDVSGIPTQWEVAIYASDPRLDGTEFDAAGGYDRILINADLTDFPSAVDGAKTSIEISLPTPTAPWTVGGDPATGTHWVLVSHDDSTTRWFFGLLAQPLDVDGTELALSTSLAEYWNTLGG